MSFLLHSHAARNGRWSTAAFALALICLCPGGSNAQQSTVIVAPGNAAVTGFSGALPPIQIAPGVDPGEKTFIDLHGPSLRVVDLQHMGGPPTARNLSAPPSPSLSPPRRSGRCSVLRSTAIRHPTFM